MYLCRTNILLGTNIHTWITNIHIEHKVYKICIQFLKHEKIEILYFYRANKTIARKQEYKKLKGTRHLEENIDIEKWRK